MLAIKEVATECPLQTPNETTIPLAIQTSEYKDQSKDNENISEIHFALTLQNYEKSA